MNYFSTIFLPRNIINFMSLQNPFKEVSSNTYLWALCTCSFYLQKSCNNHSPRINNIPMSNRYSTTSFPSSWYCVQNNYCQQYTALIVRWKASYTANLKVIPPIKNLRHSADRDLGSYQTALEEIRIPICSRRGNRNPDLSWRIIREIWDPDFS